MLRFKNRLLHVPGNKWSYRVPETGVVFVNHVSKAALLDEVQKHYTINGKVVPANLEALVEDHMCRYLGTLCEGQDDRPLEARPPTVFEVIGVTERFFRAHRYGLAEQAEVERRAGICTHCPLNDLGICTSCNGLRRMAAAFVGNRRSRQVSYLGVCRALRVSLNGLVHVNVVKDQVPEAPLSEVCWIPKVKAVTSG